MKEEPGHNNQIARWLNGSLSPEEKSELEQSGELEDLRIVLDDIATWSLPTYELEKKLEAFQERKRKERKSTKVISLTRFLQYAAIFTVITSAYFIFQFYITNKYTIITTGIGEHSSFNLPDGSLAYLDATSSIRYKPNEWENIRSLESSGQVYFDVKKGQKFEVKTTVGTVTVLGTRFSIRSIDSMLEVRCFEGKVLVFIDQSKHILTKNMGVEFSEVELKIFKVEEAEPSWFGDYTEYKMDVLTKVITDIKRYYEIQLDLPDKYKSLRFTGKVNHENIDLALKTIFVPLEIEYSFEDGKVIFY